MNRTLLQIKLLYEKMGNSEKRIADWIIENTNEILPLSITELAEKSHSSEATIVRFSRRLGYSGYQDLKISIAQESKKTLINENISENDSCIDIFEKVCNDIYLSLEKTKKILDNKHLEAACDKMIAADKIVVFGLGNSASVAGDFVHKLMRIGLNATAYSDNHMQAIAAVHLKPNDVAIGISHSGSSRDIVEAMRLSKESGASTVVITSKGKSPVLKHSDIVLSTDSDETKYSILALNSRIAQLAIIDCIYYYIAFKLDESSKTAIEKTEHGLQSKKY